MQILYLITELDPGGAERVLSDLCQGLSDKAEVTVAALDGSGDYAAQISAMGVEVIDLKARTSLSFISALRKLRKLLLKRKFDLIHTHLFHANIIGRLASWRLGLKVFSTCHITERRFCPWRFWLDRLTAGLNSVEIAVSAVVKEFQRGKTGLPDAYYRVIHNGIDLHTFTPVSQQQCSLQRKSLGLPDSGKLSVGFLGRYDYQKGPDLYVQAVNLLPSEVFAEADFFCAGYGVLEKDLWKMGEGRVQFCGYISQPQKYLQCLDICVVPSRWEGFGLVALEAMACGCSVIAADIDSLPEFITDGVNGLLCQPAKADEFSQALQRLIGNVELRDKISSEAIKAAQSFSREKMVAEHNNLYLASLDK